MSEEFNDFGLPDINRFSPFDEDYVPFLEQSVAEIENAALQHQHELAQMVPESDEMDFALPWKSGVRQMLEEKGKAIHEKAMQFSEAIKDMIYMETIYEPEHAPALARIFLEASDGMFYETRIDLRKANSYGIYVCHSWKPELLRDKDFLEHRMECFMEDAVYLASPMSDKLSIDTFFRFALVKVQDSFDEKHPEIVSDEMRMLEEQIEEDFLSSTYAISSRISYNIADSMPGLIIPPDISMN